MGDGDERVDADVVSDAKKASRVVRKEVVLDGVGGREGDGVDEDVDFREMRRRFAENSASDLFVARDIALEGLAGGGLAEVFEELFGLGAQAFQD